MGSYKMKMLSKIGYEYEKKDNLIRENYIHKDKIEIAWNPKQLKLPRTKVRKGNSAVRKKESKLKKVLQSMQKEGIVEHAKKKKKEHAVLEVTVLERKISQSDFHFRRPTLIVQS